MVIGIFLDIKKAFDGVDHNILLNKLHCYGFCGNSLKYLRSYLTNRLQSPPSGVILLMMTSLPKVYTVSEI